MIQPIDLTCPKCSRPCQAAGEQDDDFIERVSVDPKWYFQLYKQEETEEFGVIEVPQLQRFQWVNGLCTLCAKQEAKRQQTNRKYAKAEKMGQTSLFDLEPVAEADEPLPVPIIPDPPATSFFPLVNEHAEQFYLTKAQVLLEAMVRIMLSRHLKPEVKQYEILRHNQLRQAALMMVRPANLSVESECAKLVDVAPGVHRTESDPDASFRATNA